MEAFMHQGRYYDPVSEVHYEWRSEFSNRSLETAIHMRAIRGKEIALITAVFSYQDSAGGEDACIREAMARAERELNSRASENTRGVLRHLVQMARAVAA